MNSRIAATLLLCLFLQFGALAQNRILTIDQRSLLLRSTVQTDSVTSSGKAVYSVLLEFTAGSGKNEIMKTLANFREKTSVFTVSSLNSEQKIGEVRTYTGATVQEMWVDDLAGDQREAIYLHVRLLATGININKNLNEGIKMPADKFPAQMSANFRVIIEGLNTNRLVSISNIRTGSEKATLLKIAFADYDEWQTWFEKNRGQRIKVVIELLSLNMRDVTSVINLNDVLVETFTQTGTGPGNQQVPRFQVGLRPRSVTF